MGYFLWLELICLSKHGFKAHAFQVPFVLLRYDFFSKLGNSLSRRMTILGQRSIPNFGSRPFSGLGECAFPRRYCHSSRESTKVRASKMVVHTMRCSNSRTELPGPPKRETELLRRFGFTTECPCSQVFPCNLLAFGFLAFFSPIFPTDFFGYRSN